MYNQIEILCGSYMDTYGLWQDVSPASREKEIKLYLDSRKHGTVLFSISCGQVRHEEHILFLEVMTDINTEIVNSLQEGRRPFIMLNPKSIGFHAAKILYMEDLM